VVKVWRIERLYVRLRGECCVCKARITRDQEIKNARIEIKVFGPSPATQLFCFQASQHHWRGHQLLLLLLSGNDAEIWKKYGWRRQDFFVADTLRSRTSTHAQLEGRHRALLGNDSFRDFDGKREMPKVDIDLVAIAIPAVAASISVPRRVAMPDVSNHDRCGDVAEPYLYVLVRD
jgi:hypothetical protein